MKLHVRFNHPDKKAFVALNNELGLGMKIDEIDYIYDHCKTCLSGRARKNPIGRKNPSHIRMANERMDCWHMDMIGPYTGLIEDDKSQILSLDGKLYSLTILDEATRYVIVDTLSQKGEAGELIIKHINEYQTKTGKKLARLRTDGAGEFLSDKVKSFLSHNGTELVVSPPGIHEMNSYAERRNQLLTSQSRCSLIHCKAPPHLWSYNIKYMAQIQNRLPSDSHNSLDQKFPIMKMDATWKEIDITKIQPFGCDVCILNDDDKITKLSERGKFGIFLGISSDLDDRQNVYYNYSVLMEDSNGNLVVKAKRNVKFLYTFNKMEKWYDRIIQQAEKSRGDNDYEWVVDQVLADKVINKNKHFLIKWKGFKNPTWEPLTNLTNCDEALSDYNKLIDEMNKTTKRSVNIGPKPTSDHNSMRSEMHLRPNPTIINTMFEVALAVTNEKNYSYVIPKNYREARMHEDHEKWEEAEQREINSIIKNGVWNVCTLPKGRKAIGSHFVYNVKRDQKGHLDLHKARAVADGNQQVPGIDYGETFSPTTRMKTLKMLFRFAASDDWEIKQLDFDTAFLNAVLTEDIYIRPPRGYNLGTGDKNTVLKLNKALYGLKQASREWWITLDKLMRSLGYDASPQDESLYFKCINGEYIYVSTYVDDMGIFYPKSLEQVWLKDKAAISTKYKIKDIGDCEWLLNMEVIRDRADRTIKLSQEAYINKILSRFDYTNERPRKSPYWRKDMSICPPDIEPIKLNKEEIEEYRSIVGSLMYAANITRVDIAYITNLLARNLHEPYNYHLHAAYHVLGYLVGCPKLDLIFTGKRADKEWNIEIFTDSDWGGEAKDRISCGGNITKINGSVTHWEAIKQKTVSLSSCEAELYAYCDAVREAIYLREWFKFYMNKDLKIKIYCDNNGTLQVADHSTSHKRTKHIEIRQFFVREHLKQKRISIAYVPTSKNIADILTKQVNTPRFKELKKMIYGVKLTDMDENELDSLIKEGVEILDTTDEEIDDQ